MAEPRRRKSAAARKAEIVDTAIRLSAEIGPDRVTTQHLADAVGVTQPAIFRHFATKADIWLAVCDRIIEEMSAMHRVAPEIHADGPHAMLHHVVGTHLAHVAKNPAIPAILYSRELASSDEKLRNRVAAHLAERRASLAALVRRAQDAGVHRKELTADDAAWLMLAAIQGIAMRWLIENRVFDLADEGGRVLGGLIDSFLV